MCIRLNEFIFIIIICFINRKGRHEWIIIINFVVVVVIIVPSASLGLQFFFFGQNVLWKNIRFDLKILTFLRSHMIFGRKIAFGDEKKSFIQKIYPQSSWSGCKMFLIQIANSRGWKISTTDQTWQHIYYVLCFFPQYFDKFKMKN